jgi:hypothetical protein
MPKNNLVLSKTIYISNYFLKNYAGEGIRNILLNLKLNQNRLNYYKFYWQTNASLEERKMGCMGWHVPRIIRRVNGDIVFLIYICKKRMVESIIVICLINHLYLQTDSQVIQELVLNNQVTKL